MDYMTHKIHWEYGEYDNCRADGAYMCTAVSFTLRWFTPFTVKRSTGHTAGGFPSSSFLQPQCSSSSNEELQLQQLFKTALSEKNNSQAQMCVTVPSPGQTMLPVWAGHSLSNLCLMALVQTGKMHLPPPYREEHSTRTS